MKKIFVLIKGKIISFIKQYPEIISIPAVLLTWVLSIRILRFFDPTSAVFDSGVFQIPIFAVLEFFLFVSIAWLAMKLIFTTIRNYLVISFKLDFFYLTSWQKITLSYCVFFSLLAALVLLSKTLSA